MKKLITLLMLVVMLFGVAACTVSEPEDVQPEDTEAADAPSVPDEEEEVELVKMNVAVMPYQISLPVFHAIENNLDEEYGLELEMVMFANGATMNEAMASDQFDVTLTGGAGIYGIATYDGVYISDAVYYMKPDDGEPSGGDGIYCLADNPATETRGFNPDYPNLYGDPDSIKGSTILYTSGTTAHQLVIMWLNAMGVGLDEVNMLNMDFAQSYQALTAEQADFACLTSPYTTQAQDAGYASVADGKSLHQNSVESIMAPRSYYENNKENLAKFLNMIYESNRMLEEGGIDYKVEWMEKWYDYNGTDYTDEEVYAEFALGEFVTWDNMDTVEYGAYAHWVADFYNLNELLTDEAVENVSNNIVTDVMELARSME